MSIDMFTSRTDYLLFRISTDDAMVQDNHRRNGSVRSPQDLILLCARRQDLENRRAEIDGVACDAPLYKQRLTQEQVDALFEQYMSRTAAPRPVCVLTRPPSLDVNETDAIFEDASSGDDDDVPEMDLMGGTHGPMPRRNRRAFKPRTRRGKQGGKSLGSQPRVMINNNGSFAPDRMRTWLSYDQQFTMVAATALAPWGLAILKLTAPPNLTTVPTNIPGFNALAADYRKYRQYIEKIVFSLTNKDLLVPIEMFVMVVNFQPSTSTDPNTYFNLCKPNKRKVLSFAPGMNVGKITYTVNNAKFGGSSSTRVEDQYVGLTGGAGAGFDPADNVWAIYGYRTIGSTAITIGPGATISVQLDGEYFELQSPAV